MDEAKYQMGFALARHWGLRDATEEQLCLVRELGDGRDWVAMRRDAASEFTKLVDASKDGFMGVGENPSNSFVAGFIDGAQTVQT